MPELKITNSPVAWPDAVTDVFASTDQRYTLGQLREENGKKYRFCKFDNGTGNVAAVANKLCYWLPSSTNDFIVTSDESDSKSPAGVFNSAPADLGFCWVETWGRVTALATDGTDDIVKGDRLIALTGGADGVVTRPTVAGANPTAAEARALLRSVGTALADDVDAANTVDAFIDLE